MRVKVILCISLSLLIMASILAYAENEEHVYYGFVPIGTDAGFPNTYPQ